MRGSPGTNGRWDSPRPAPSWESIPGLLVIKFRDLCTKAGLDEDMAMYSISWAMECYEKGILNRKDTDGIELRFGKEDAFIRMTEKIIAREGFGDILARGAHEAARLVGKGSEKYALTIKGKEIERMPQRNGYQMALALAVCEGGPDHTRWYPPYPPNPRSYPIGYEAPHSILSRPFRPGLWKTRGGLSSGSTTVGPWWRVCLPVST